jgi:hypothetical protein
MGNFLSREECAQRRGKVYPQALRLYAIEAKPISGQIGRLGGKVRSGVKQHRQVKSRKRNDGPRTRARGSVLDGAIIRNPSQKEIWPLGELLTCACRAGHRPAALPLGPRDPQHRM